MTKEQKQELIKLRCKAWGITEDEYYCNQCSDFSLEDMARAYRRGKNKGRAEQEAIDEGYARTLQTMQLNKAKELLKQWLQTSKASACDNINIVSDTEQFLSEVEK